MWSPRMCSLGTGCEGGKKGHELYVYEEESSDGDDSDEDAADEEEDEEWGKIEIY